MSRQFTYIGLGLLGLIIAAGTRSLHTKHVQASAPAANVASASFGKRSSLNGANPTGQFSRPITIDPRAERRKATDYRQLMNLLLPLAKTGSASAQYELASALHYCDENLHAHFISPSTGAVRTQEEIQRLYAKLDENTQQLLDEAYQRCKSFMGDSSILKTYSDWLDQAEKAGYQQAIFMKADLMLKMDLIKGDSAEVEQARQLAITATMIADPDVLFGMADFVDGAGKTREQAGQLMSAWWLLGCERGYDCSAQSDFIRSTCTIDAQCANKPTVVEQLQRVNGAKFDEVQQLAEQIGAAVDSHDPAAIRKYL